MNAFDIDRQGTASGSASIRIDAPLDVVWQRLTDLAEWPSWNSAIQRISVSGPIAVGTTFDWKAGGLPIRSRIERIEPTRVIGWSGTAPLIRARHVYHLRDANGMTEVHTEESFSGFLAALLPGKMSQLIVSSLEQGLAALKNACDRCDGRDSRPDS